MRFFSYNKGIVNVHLCGQKSVNNCVFSYILQIRALDAKKYGQAGDGIFYGFLGNQKAIFVWLLSSIYNY